MFFTLEMTCFIRNILPQSSHNTLFFLFLCSFEFKWESLHYKDIYKSFYNFYNNIDLIFLDDLLNLYDRI